MKKIILILSLFPIVLFSQAIDEQNIINLYLNQSPESDDNYIQINHGTLSNSVTLTLPNSVGANEQILTTDGNGTTTWSTISTSGSPSAPDQSVQFNDNGTFGSSSSFVWDYNNSSLGINISSPTFTVNVNGNIRTGSDGTNGTIYFASNGSSEHIVIRTSSMTISSSELLFTLPSNQSSQNQGLLTNSSGSLSWGGDITNGPVTDQEASSNNNINDNDAENAYLGGGDGNDINTDADNSVMFGGDNNNMNGNQDDQTISSGI